MTVAQASSYRISLDAPLWIDVLANGGALAARDFQGRAGCSAPHKIVEFELPANTPLTLHTRSPARPAPKRRAMAACRQSTPTMTLSALISA